MNPYASGYSNPKNITAPFKLARCTSGISSAIPDCPVSSQTVNLTELATAFMGKAKTESNYKRLQRFFRHFKLNYYDLAKLVVGLMEIPQPWVLSIDRTTWEFGNSTINILMLGVVHNRVAFPLLWWMLDKRGNSNTGERIDLLEEFFELFAEVKVAYLSADREFLVAGLTSTTCFLSSRSTNKSGVYVLALPLNV